MASKLKVGVNYPWKNYVWDFGMGPYSYSESKWKKAVQEDLTQLKNLGIFAVRWFILADGLTYGTGTKHGRQTGDRWCVSGTCTVIDIIGSNHCPHKLHDGIVVLVGIPCRCHAGNGV